MVLAWPVESNRPFIGHEANDCGFGTFAGGEFVAEDVVWAKLRSCRAGADIASKRLWGRVDA